jgi:hypothetical protein
MKVKVVTHYSKKDPTFVGDYYCIAVLDEKGKSIYFKHDDEIRGKVNGFLSGLLYMLSKTGEELIIERVSKADIFK